jgi:hypothetical protein
MQNGRALLTHPRTLRRPWYADLAVAASDVAKHLALTLAVVLGGTVVVALMLMTLLVTAPLGGALLGCILWRSARGGARQARRFTLRARRRARALGLRLVGDAVDAQPARSAAP